MDTDYWIAQAQTLRYLPPNTPLITDQEADEKLLNELLNIDPDLDLIQWLMDNQSDLCVKLLLWQCLDSLRSNLIGLRRTITETAPDAIDQIEEEVGYKFNEQDMALLRPLAYTHPLAAAEDRLLTLFSGLRRREMVIRDTDSSPNLRNRLLLLPNDANPLVWLRENHLKYAAAATSRYLIEQLIPKSDWNFEHKHDMPSPSPKPVCRSNHIAFTLKGIFPVFDIIAIYLTFRVYHHQLRILGSEELTYSYPYWKGIGNLSDDLENRYLICHHRLIPKAYFPCSLWWMDYELRLFFFPSIAKSAQQMFLSFDNAMLIARRIQALDNDLHYSVPLGKLKWTVDLNPLRQRYSRFFS